MRSIWKAQLQTVGIVAVVWVAFDAFFAKAFFKFPNETTHFPAAFPGYPWTGRCEQIWRIWDYTCYELNIPLEVFF